MRTVRWIIVVWVSLLAATLIFEARRRPAPVIEEPIARPIAARQGMWTGSASCVGRSCHGGLEPRPTQPGDDGCQQNEYTTIAARDPHARAFRVLRNERSRQMARLLGDPDGAADTMPRCLACHTTSVDESLAKIERSFGVGCESCHGPAASWIDEHHRKDKKKPPGLVRLDHPEVRAKACAVCHVGSAGGDVDHDLIAAGHPRLLFEFVAFNEGLPPHWKPKPRDVAHDWFVGQIAAAEATLDVLTHRAESPAAPWPEFAEYDCFSCHHDLKTDSWRQLTARKHKAGTLIWDSWNTSVIDRLLEQNKLSAAPWRSLQGVMQSLPPDRASVLLKASDARNRLKELAQKDSRGLEGIGRLRKFVEGQPKMFESWEAAEQHWLAMRALVAATQDPSLAAKRDALAARRGLTPGFDSPKEFDPRVK